jgi:hypothetical protein
MKHARTRLLSDLGIPQASTAAGEGVYGTFEVIWLFANGMLH